MKKKTIAVEFVLMTNRELTKDFVKEAIEGAKGGGWDMDEYRVINGETYKLKSKKIKEK